MQSIHGPAAATLKMILDAQPLTEAKVGFAWRVAAGPTLATAATVAWSPGGPLRLTPRSDAWRQELVRARGVLLEKIRALLGPDAVTTIRVESPL